MSHPAPHRTDPDGLHLALAGVGRIGAMHAAHLAATPGVARITLADVAVEHARALAASLRELHPVQVGAVADVTELLEHPADLDGLVVATGTAQHPALVEAGVRAGLPVLCEKPLAPDVAAAQAVLDLVAELGGVVRIGHQRRHDAGYAEARRAVAAGELGWLHSVRALTCDAAPPPVAFLATSGGLFRDCSVHDVDAVRWTTGREVVEVWARGSNGADVHEGAGIAAVGDVDTALGVLTLDDGTLAVLTASRFNGAGHDVRLELQGSLGSIAVGLDDRTALRSAEPGQVFPAGPPHRTFHERFADAYRAEVAAFVDLVRTVRAGGVPDDEMCRPEDAVAASRVADALQESLATGLPVRLG